MAIEAVVKLAGAGRFDEVVDLFAPELRAAVSADFVRIAWTKEVGAVHAVGEPVSLGDNRFSVLLNGTVELRMSVDDQGRVNGLRLTAAGQWEPPLYAKPELFTEQEVLVGSQPGALVLPHNGNGAGIVLLSGAGAFDRDETAGPVKMLKDLAWGLAGLGVASVRFDKPADAPTLVEEYLPAAVAGVELLAGHVDRVFVAGHSAGGKIAPKVAQWAPAVAGVVLLAADTSPMPAAALRVARHLDLGVELMTRLAARAASPDLTPDTPASELPFGFPATYWLQLREYDQVRTAIEVDRPVLALQGGRDYQVTVEDDLPGWRRVPRAEVRIYPELDHMFFASNGSHLDETVIADIAQFTRRRA
ncbi:alpha/beta hydrolase [Kutzneria sp. CA-103260]|uniref:alpha/beta hydrolase n=1 Tax=Kutzneria sp. CA-103260 TaxID=2802641 RepID=UPI001BA8D8B5|nr:alpha/beta hydrolase [Kutzneria sp. CA-103260]QUQ66835.1 Esterase EstD [Kutzneria sp. CA-103260]